MTRQSTPHRSIFSASAVMQALAHDLSVIKHEDGLTDADIGRVLGKSEDMAAKYRAGLAEMGAVAIAAGKREWNGRFTGSFDQLCVESRPGKVNDHGALTVILDLAARLSKALEDGEIKPEEVRANRAALEDARTMIDGLLCKLVRAA